MNKYIFKINKSNIYRFSNHTYLADLQEKSYIYKLIISIMKTLMVVSFLILGTSSFGQESCYVIKKQISLYDSEIRLYENQIIEYNKKMEEYSRTKDTQRDSAINYGQYKGMRDNAMREKEMVQSKKSDAEYKLLNCKN